MTTVRQWQRAVKPEREVFYSRLVGVAECGPFDGGCLIVARALQRVIGGELVVVTRPDDMADHAAVFQCGKLWDYEGPLWPSKFIARFNRSEALARPCTGFRRLRDSDLVKAYRSPDLERELAALFHKSLQRIPDLLLQKHDVVPEVTPMEVERHMAEYLQEAANGIAPSFAGRFLTPCQPT